MNLIDIYKMFYPTAANYTWTFTKIDHILFDKIKLTT